MKRFLFISLFVCICLFSCQTRSGSGNLPMSIGSAGEMLVIMRDYLWKGSYGDSVRKYFSEPVWGLPAQEPMYTMSQKDALTPLLQRYRNVLIINVDPGFEYSNIRVRENLHANNQVVYNVDVPSADSIVSCVYKNKDRIIAHFLMKDRDAIIQDYKRNVARPVVDSLKKKFMIDILIPKPYELDVDRDNFVWISREEGHRTWGILIWEQPYLRLSQLDTDSLIFNMNAMTRRHVPGRRVGSYMADEPLVPPEVKRFYKNDIYCVQLNGLWQMENGFMGGPYVNHTIVDIQRGRLVTAMGFVFYPNREKRQMIRQLEAILYTMNPLVNSD